MGRKSELRSTQEARDQFQFDELSLKHLCVEVREATRSIDDNGVIGRCGRPFASRGRIVTTPT